MIACASTGRCVWASTARDSIYHDAEWGVPVHDDRILFEFLILEGAQAGLSWSTVLKKREHYRQVFDQFDPQLVARYDAAKIAALLLDPGIIRNRLKISAAVQNARHFLEVQAEFGSFDTYLWCFVAGAPVQNHWDDRSLVPVSTPISNALSKDLARRGFKFVGTTIMYAFMQAVGMVNDHTTDCFRYAELTGSYKR